MPNLANIEFIDSVLMPLQLLIGKDFQGYRNHVIRMCTFCLMLKECNAEAQQKIEIAACFHDIGLWTENTVDYLPPSIVAAEKYLKANQLDHWIEEVSQMIDLHHKLTPVPANLSPLAETFRQADLIDFSLGTVKFSLTKDAIRKMQTAFPNAGFHKMLVKRASRWFFKHPFNPAPMMKW